MLLLDIWLVLGYDASVRTPLVVNRFNVSESIDMPSTRFEPPSVKNKAKRQEIASAHANSPVWPGSDYQECCICVSVGASKLQTEASH